MVNYNVVNLFPTSIYVGEIENHEEYRKVFYSEIYSKYDFPHENERGGLNTSSVNCGRPLLHHERKLEPLFRSLTEHMRNYCRNVLMMRDIFDIQVMKSWMSRSYSSNENVPLHIHSTSHLSFVYYLSANERSNYLTFVNENHPNHLFEGLTDMDSFDDPEAMMSGYNFETTPEYSIEPQEGMIVVFPSRLPHMTLPREQNEERLAIAGDCLLTLKRNQPMIYSQGFVSPEYWRTFTP